MAQVDLRVAQKNKLFALYRIKNRNKGMEVKGLDDEILETEAEMEKEDVAYIKEKASQIK
jgi:hypothetical protein